MYLSFYHLKHKPFQISTDPRFLWLGEKHEEGLATLRYGVLDNKGFLLLTGDVGTGKTTLINALLKTLGNNILVATVRDPDLEPMDFYTYTAHAFGLPGNFASKGAFLIGFERFLHQANAAQKTVLLIIDEAQRINQKLLEEVRLLSNIELEDKKLLNIFFVGQIEFNEILLRPENRPIRQRITVNYNIQPLSKKETRDYIHHRLKVAGTERKIFEEEAINAIFSFSQGYPRLINIICDRSLLTGYVEEAQTITEEHVRECITELTIPQFFTQKPPTPETVAPPSPDDQTSISLLRANATKNTPPARKSILPAILIISLLAASCLFFVVNNFTGSREESVVKQAANLWHQLFAQKKIPSSADKTSPPVGIRPPEGGQIKTNPLEIQKPGNSLPENNKAATAVMQTEDRNTAEEDNVASQEPAEKNLNSQDTGSTDHTVTKEAQEWGVEHAKPVSLDAYNKLIIPFPADSSFPAEHMVDDLDRLAQSLLLRPEFKVIITGYTDSSGHESYNRKLSEFRAQSIKSYLAGKGLAESRITAQGFGSQNPIAPNDSPAGRVANRRVEIELQQ